MILTLSRQLVGATKSPYSIASGLVSGSRCSLAVGKHDIHVQKLVKKNGQINGFATEFRFFRDLVLMEVLELIGIIVWFIVRSPCKQF